MYQKLYQNTKVLALCKLHETTSLGLRAFSLNGVRKSTALQFDDEGCPVHFFTLNADGAAVLQDNLTTKTEADACTRGFGGEEGNESMFKNIGRHAVAVVLYTNLATAVSRYLYLGGSALVGVLDEVNENLFYLGAVSRQLSLTLGLYLRVESYNMLEEFADRKCCSLRCFDARQLSITLHKAE